MQMPSINFTGVIGKKIIERSNNPADNSITTTLIYRPFAGEEKLSNEEKAEMIDCYKKSKRAIEAMHKTGAKENKVKIRVGRELNFDFAEFKRAELGDPTVSDDAKQFVNEEYGNIIYKPHNSRYLHYYA